MVDSPFLQVHQDSLHGNNESHPPRDNTPARNNTWRCGTSPYAQATRPCKFAIPLTNPFVGDAGGQMYSLESDEMIHNITRGKTVTGIVAHKMPG